MKLHHLRTAFLVICLLLVCSQGRSQTNTYDDNNTNLVYFKLDDWIYLEGLVDKVMQGIDLDAVIPNPIVVYPDADGNGYIDDVTYNCVYWSETNQATGYKVTKAGAFSYQQPVVEYIRGVNGGLQFRISMKNLDLPISFYGVLDSGCLGEASALVSGNVLAQSITVEGTAVVSLSNESPNVDFSNLTSDIYHPDAGSGFPYLYLDIDYGILSHLLDSAAGRILSNVTSNISNLLEAEVQARMEPVLQDFLAANAIPEPTTLLLALLALVVAPLRVRCG